MSVPSTASEHAEAYRAWQRAFAAYVDALMAKMRSELDAMFGVVTNLKEYGMEEELETVLARFDSVVCDELQTEAIEKLREGAKDLAEMIVKLCPQSRSKALALTHLEDSSVWAIKAVAKRE